MKIENFKLELNGRHFNFEIRDLAEQANGACFLRYGDTEVLATAVMSKAEKPDMGFFPLTVDYEERYYAAGKIKGPRYIKRETRPSDEAICNARLIDRAIRPLFPDYLKKEIQVINTVLSWDGQNDPDVVGLHATSLALAISDIPWHGPVAAVRIGKVNGDFILNPTYEEKAKSKMDLLLASTLEKDEVLINMIEAGFEEMDEETVVKAVQFAQPYLKSLIDFQKDIAKKIGKEKMVFALPPANPAFENDVKKILGEKLEEALYSKKKEERSEKMRKLEEELVALAKENYPDRISEVKSFLSRETDRIIHENIIQKEKRPDGRKIDEVREIQGEVGILPRTHGSGIFSRGQTKSISILTLGAPGDQQILEGMEIVGKKRFMHHYNFPPYSTGEVKPMRGPGRREIGHGMLAEKALLPLIPNFEEFPYTIRVVSEILSSNGSSSMASVSSSSLSLMDAGVPIRAPATGIALGLMSDEKGNYKILTDIQGPEDHHGDMDFKVAGTRQGITAIQMDVKIKGISDKILAEALERGKKARYGILTEIEKVLAKPRPELSPLAPRILTIQINPDKIRDVIGSGGKIINKIIDECGVAIDIEETGKIFVTAEKEEAARKAIKWIENLTREIKVGEIFQGIVKKLFTFGAVVEIFPGQEGLVHISQLAPHRVGKVEDVVKIGDGVKVKVIAVDEEQGKISLSIKEAKEFNENTN